MTAQEIITLFFYLIALTWYKRQRNYYVLRLLGCFIAALLLCVPLAILRTYFNIIPVRIFNITIVMGIVYGSLFILYQESFAELTLCFSGVIAAKNFSGNLFALLLNLCGVDDLYSMSFFNGQNSVVDWSIYWLVHAGLLVGIYIFLRKRERLEDESSVIRAILLAITIYVVTAILSTFARAYQANDFTLSVIVKVYMLFIYAFMLVLRSNLLFRNKISKELQITEQLLYQEKKHYAEMKNNIDVINMKCHDLKQQLTELQGKLTQEEIDSLQEAIQIYDNSIKTGNDIVDTVLYQKKLYCDKNGILLKYLVQGELFSQIDGNDLYTLLSNALNNAIEASIQLSSSEKRIISFVAGKQNDSVLIEVTNFFNPLSQVKSGTSKQDKQHHGYGIRSMQYVTSLYKGTLNYYTQGDIFFLTISLPLHP